MASTTEQDLIAAAGGAERLDELLSRPAPSGVADARAYWLAQAQTQADSRIDGYIPARYATPLAAPSALVVRLAAEEAIFWLRETGGILTAADVEGMTRRMTELRDIRDGKIWPGDPLPAQSTGRRSVFLANGRRVNHTNLRRVLG